MASRILVGYGRHVRSTIVVIGTKLAKSVLHKQTYMLDTLPQLAEYLDASSETEWRAALANTTSRRQFARRLKRTRV